ncbi:DUF2889 domain-containing protein [Desulfosporosinus sp. PR]|uniref:DUF2889 domain-containing protein n=1 Tax=Candidatus Desulfosporosinus nitrosoreducens TaxID=3401928 RepID=UPI0027EA83E2|nr:DUF2889 domain-containing protein [Desulfosporosinus sp. PR]MDQ7092134.1 DUF2889 domain-containing protein [Desulfosporosinus sp. PR]
MEALFQRNWYTEVRRSGNGLLKAKTSYVDTHREAVAHLTVDINTFVIQEAFWEEQRSSQPIKARTLQVTPLLGSEAYLSSAGVLKETAAFLKDSLATALFSETVKGIIQAETFLLSERGYSSKEDYDSAWMNFYSGSCRYFSNLNRITKTWFDHVGESERTGNLFVRFKTQSFINLGENSYLLIGNLSDSFHEVNVQITLKEGIVEEVNGALLRAPDLVCRESVSLLSNLQGIAIKGTGKKELAGILGGEQGCIHLIDLVNDCIKAIIC